MTDDKQVGTAQIGYYSPGMGKSQYEITCVCGASAYYYIWAMAGNGCAKCKGCKRIIKYGWGWPIYEKAGVKYPPLPEKA